MSGRNRSQQDVELNMASMLDMAFQLLAFFVLTFQPPPLESQISLRLPPLRGGATGGADQEVLPDPKLDTLTVSVFSRSGNIDLLGVAGQEVKDLPELNGKLAAIFKNADNPFQQVVVRSSPKLRYGELMQVVNVCTHQKFPDGKKLDKLSFAELPETNNHERWNVGQ